MKLINPRTFKIVRTEEEIKDKIQEYNVELEKALGKKALMEETGIDNYNHELVYNVRENCKKYLYYLSIFAWLGDE